MPVVEPLLSNPATIAVWAGNETCKPHREWTLKGRLKWSLTARIEEKEASQSGQSASKNDRNWNGSASDQQLQCQRSQVRNN